MVLQALALRMAVIGYTPRQVGEAIQHKVRLCSYAVAKRETLPGAEPRQNGTGIHVRAYPLRATPAVVGPNWTGPFSNAGLAPAKLHLDCRSSCPALAYV